ncbi:hypothetical protein BDQ17DRAFT_608351 [Cyathus striatus]|nr:hypothetical protein BDQ17DRAFT_608351 [Cyathus striatus]
MSSVPPSSSPTPSQSDAPTSYSNTSSNLYLVTFLATLFLLLFVSCAIVLRSFILRRRYQRRLEEALAAGIILTPRSPGSKKKRFGAKPKLFDAYLSDGGEKWEDIMPLAAQPVTSKRRYKDKNNGANQLLTSPPASVPSPSHHSITPPSPAPPVRPPTSRRGTHSRPLWRAFLPSRNRPIDEDDDTPVDDIVPTNDPVKPTHVRIELLQVSVLVAMPSLARSNRQKLASCLPLFLTEKSVL